MPAARRVEGDPEPAPSTINCCSWPAYQRALEVLSTSDEPLAEIGARWPTSASQISSTLGALGLMTNGRAADTQLRRLRLGSTSTFKLLKSRLGAAVDELEKGGYTYEVDRRLAAFGGSPDRLRRFIVAAGAEDEVVFDVQRKPRNHRVQRFDGPGELDMITSGVVANVLEEIDVWTDHLRSVLQTDPADAEQISRKIAQLRRDALKLRPR